MIDVYIALGSNIDPEDNLKAAATMLREHFSDVRFSSVYRTAPMLHEKQDDFLNAVAMFETDLQIAGLNAIILHIEKNLKKDPPFKFGPRTIDLDVLLYGDQKHEGILTTPHPRMHERRFVLQPLVELIDPSAKHPVLQKTWQELLEGTSAQECQKTQIRL